MLLDEGRLGSRFKMLPGWPAFPVLLGRVAGSVVGAVDDGSVIGDSVVCGTAMWWLSLVPVDHAVSAATKASSTANQPSSRLRRLVSLNRRRPSDVGTLGLLMHYERRRRRECPNLHLTSPQR